MRKFDIYADDIIMAFIKLAGYFCLFVSGLYSGRAMECVEPDPWMINIAMASFVAFIITRIYVGIIERARRDE